MSKARAQQKVQKDDRMSAHIANADGLADLEGRSAPCQEHNALTSLTLLRCDAPRRDGLQNSSRKGLPALLRMGVRLVCANSQAGVQP
jgi:hypothetical protein